MHHTRRKCDAPAVPEHYIDNLKGKLIHLSWAYAGSVWRLIDVAGDIVYLETPKTKEKREDKIKNVRFTKNEYENYLKFLERKKNQKNSNGEVNNL